jgi:hypothetical protein
MRRPSSAAPAGPRLLPARPRARALATVAAVTGALAAAAACNALTGLDADYTLKAPDGGRDGDVTADGANVGDARDDTTSTKDAGGDATTDAAFCPTKGPDDFCWDFEAPSAPPSFGWGPSSQISGSGTAAVEDGAGVGGSRGFHATLTNPTAQAQAYLQQAVGTGKFTDFRTHELSLMLLVKKDMALNTAALGLLGFGASAGQYAGLAVFSAAGTPGALDLSSPPSNGTAGTSVIAVKDRWYSVVVSLDRAGGTGPYTASMAIDGLKVDEGQQLNASGASPTQVLVGAFFPALGAGVVDVVIDNVMVRQTK